MSYFLHVTDDAHADFDRILGPLRRQSVKAAAKLAPRSYDALGRLRTMPLSCGLAYESRTFHEELRHLLFWVQPKRKYRALFAVRGDEVVVLAVRAPAKGRSSRKILPPKA